MYVRTAVAIVAFRALDCSTRTNETRPFAWRRLANGVASHRIDRTGFTGLHRRGNAASHRTCWKTILHDSMKLLLSETRGRGFGLSLTRKAAPNKSERCFWREFSRKTQQKKLHETLCNAWICREFKHYPEYLYK